MYYLEKKREKTTMVQLRNHDVENGIEREVVQTALFIAFSGLLIGFLDQQQREPN